MCVVSFLLHNAPPVDNVVKAGDQVGRNTDGLKFRFFNSFFKLIDKHIFLHTGQVVINHLLFQADKLLINILTNLEPVINQFHVSQELSHRSSRGDISKTEEMLHPR